MAAKPKPKKMSSKQMKKTKGGAGIPSLNIPSVEAPPRTRTGSVGSNPPPNMPEALSARMPGLLRQVTTSSSGAL